MVMNTGEKMKKYAYGIDIGGTAIKLGLFETSGSLLSSWEIPTRKEGNGSCILHDIMKSLNLSMKENNLSSSDVEGIGMGIPGPVGKDGTVYKCVNLGWDVFNIEEEMHQLSGMRVKAANDANVAALGEMWQGGGRGYEDIVMVTLGTGVGSGIIINGQIVNGINGAAGEIGHILVDSDEKEVCGCGKKGCLEQYTSARGIVRIARRYLHDYPTVKSSLRDIDNFTSKDIFEQYDKGDIVSQVIVDTACETLGRAMATISCVLNPEVFVIGGGMSKAGQVLIEKIAYYYKKYAFHATEDTAFHLATLGNNAGIYGAVKLLL